MTQTEEFLVEQRRKAGQKGGKANVRRYGPAHFTTIGKKGGESTKERYGSDFYSRIGKLGGRGRTAKKEEEQP